MGLFAGATVPPAAAPRLNLYYDPANGNLKLQNTTSSSLAIGAFDILTLGNGSIGPTSGQTSNRGFLSLVSATLPSFSFPVSNFSAFGVNGLYSQAGGTNTLSGSSGTAFTLSAYSGWSSSNPIGASGSFWNLGNIAITGMTQAQLNARFITDPDYAGAIYQGKFLFSYLLSGAWQENTLGDVVAL